MSDAISKAIETMDMARSAVGPFAMVVTKKLTESIAALEALRDRLPVSAQATEKAVIKCSTAKLAVFLTSRIIKSSIWMDFHHTYRLNQRRDN
jgi:hypothetical protein